MYAHRQAAGAPGAERREHDGGERRLSERTCVRGGVWLACFPSGFGGLWPERRDGEHAPRSTAAHGQTGAQAKQERANNLAQTPHNAKHATPFSSHTWPKLTVSYACFDTATAAASSVVADFVVCSPDCVRLPRAPARHRSAHRSNTPTNAPIPTRDERAGRFSLLPPQSSTLISTSAPTGPHSFLLLSCSPVWTSPPSLDSSSAQPCARS